MMKAKAVRHRGRSLRSFVATPSLVMKRTSAHLVGSSGLNSVALSTSGLQREGRSPSQRGID